MKGFKTIAFMFAAFLGVALAVSKPIKAEAQSHLVYYDNDDDDHSSDDGWYYIYGLTDTGERDRYQEAREDMYYLKQRFRSGDNLIVDGYGNQPGSIVNIDLRGTSINEITVKNAKGVIIYADHINKVSVIFHSEASIHGDVDTAQVYENSSAEFYSNVGNMHIKSMGSEDLLANVHVQGTVGYFDGTNDNSLFYVGSNVKAGKFRTEKGSLKTDDPDYTRGGSPVAGSGSASTNTAAESTPSASSSGSSSGVALSPKTGDIPVSLAVLVLAVTGFAFSMYKFGYRSQREHS
ncbi:MAG: hypothetical protein IJ608_12525 [Lachnospiraceae bacterium]|nr:hypothetical protein [Lachnospiraceae bacterium]